MTDSILVIAAGFDTLQTQFLGYMLPQEAENLTVWDRHDVLDRLEVVNKGNSVILVNAGSPEEAYVFNLDTQIPILVVELGENKASIVTEKPFSTISERYLAASSELTVAQLLSKAIDMVVIEKTEIHYQ